MAKYPRFNFPPHSIKDISTKIRKIIAWDLHEMQRNLKHEPLDEKETRKICKYAKSLNDLKAAEAAINHAPGCLCPECDKGMNTAENVLRLIMHEHGGDSAEIETKIQ